MRDVHWESLVDPRTRAVWAKVGWTAFCFAFAGALLSMHGSPHAEVRLTLPQWAIFPGPFWVSLGAMFGSLALVFVAASRYLDRVFVTIGFVITLTLPAFWFTVYGSDGPSVLGLAERFTQTGVLNPRDNVYFQWPLFFNEILIGRSILGLSLPGVLALLTVILSIATPLSMIPIFERIVPDSGPTAVILYFSGFYLVLNWQPVPQTLGFLLFLQCLLLVPRRGASPIAFATLFAAIGLLHPFVGTWLILFLVFSGSLEFALQRKTSSLGALLAVVAIQAAILAYQSTLFFGQVARVLSGYLKAVSDVQLTQGGVTRYGLLAQRLPNSVSDVALRAIGWINLAIVLVMIGIAFVRGIRRIAKSPFQSGLVLSGLFQVIGGFFAPILGVRGFQVAALPLPSKVLEAGRTSRKKTTPLVVAVVILLFVGNVVGMFSATTNYQNDQEHAAAQFYDANVYGLPKRVVVLADHSMAGYLGSRLPARATLIDSLLLSPNLIDSSNPNVVCLSSQLRTEFDTLGFFSNTKFNTYFDRVASSYLEIYDSGDVQWLVSE